MTRSLTALVLAFGLLMPADLFADTIIDPQTVSDPHSAEGKHIRKFSPKENLSIAQFYVSLQLESCETTAKQKEQLDISQKKGQSCGDTDMLTVGCRLTYKTVIVTPGLPQIFRRYLKDAMRISKAPAKGNKPQTSAGAVPGSDMPDLTVPTKTLDTALKSYGWTAVTLQKAYAQPYLDTAQQTVNAELQKRPQPTPQQEYVRLVLLEAARLMKADLATWAAQTPPAK